MKAPHSEHHRRRVRILCLDDDPGIRLVCEQVLARFGYDVDTVEDGSAGWMAMQREEYDLLITDNDMPGLSGLELLRRMRLAQIGLPAVLMSGAFGSGLIEDLSQLEKTTILRKPFTPEQLLTCISQGLPAATMQSGAP